LNTKAADGTALCKPGDWVSVHYKAKLSRDLREVSDTKINPGTDKKPVNFLLGASDTFKCFDLALQKLHKGDNATLSCPSFYAWGGARTEAPLGGGIIPYNSDITFDVEVLDCNREK
jgi:FKBP-type peptidyl-prolyl cis-trans isomerase